MGEVRGFRRKHWSGLEVDMASIPTPAIGDTYEATDTGRKYKYDGTRWRGGYEYVVRDAIVIDFDENDFTTDGIWKINGLDLSAIVPAGAVAVNLMVTVGDDAANSLLNIRRNATQVLNLVGAKTHVANIITTQYGIVAIDSDRLLDYNGTNLVFAVIQVTVKGWFI